MPQSLDGLKTGIKTLASGMAATLVGVFMLGRYLPHIPYLRDVIPANPTPQEVTVEGPHGNLARVGDAGVCESDLRPAGKARFGSTLVNVVTEGDLVSAGTRVEVIQRDGNRVVVRKDLEA